MADRALIRISHYGIVSAAGIEALIEFDVCPSSWSGAQWNDLVICRRCGMLVAKLRVENHAAWHLAPDPPDLHETGEDPPRSTHRPGMPHNVIGHPLLVLWPRVGEWIHAHTRPMVPRRRR